MDITFGFLVLASFGVGNKFLGSVVLKVPQIVGGASNMVKTSENKKRQLKWQLKEWSRSSDAYSGKTLFVSVRVFSEKDKIQCLPGSVGRMMASQGIGCGYLLPQTPRGTHDWFGSDKTMALVRASWWAWGRLLLASASSLPVGPPLPPSRLISHLTPSSRLTPRPKTILQCHYTTAHNSSTFLHKYIMVIMLSSLLKHQ